MMPLTLTLLRCPDSVAPEARTISGGELSIGRGSDNDWVLPDPERHLSKRHCVVAFHGGEWHVGDLSTNGTFLNADDQPIGNGRSQVLRDGDRLRLGAYEMEARLTGERVASSATWPGTARSRRPSARDPFGEDRVSASLNPFEEEPSAPAASVSISLPADYDPLAPEPADSLHPGPTQPDHSPPIEDAFRPPRPAASLLPDDWDIDLSRPSGSPPSHPGSKPPEPPPPVPNHGDLMSAFLEGAGVADARPGDELETMRMLGRAFRAMVAGLRQLMIARAGIKSEFRIEQTMIRSRGNNPLKFSADDDDALAALLGTGRRAGMPPDVAVADALRDMRAHELATIAAMQEAMRAVLARLDPARIRDSAEVAGLVLVPAQRKARAWDAYQNLYAATLKALSDDFDSVFGKAFARSYEQALRELAEPKA